MWCRCTSIAFRLLAMFHAEKLGESAYRKGIICTYYVISVVKMVVFLSLIFLLTEITISLTTTALSVSESALAQVSIAAFGFPENIDPFSFRSPLEAFILLYTGDGSAQSRHYCCYIMIAG